ncbi:MAG: ferritin-like domain-containing protein [Clostridia bacterium]|nr:ferritin-like domain-containing protein [Clostridia bacterium]
MDHKNLLADLYSALEDEREAIAFYSRLAEMAPNNDARRVILGIRRDEQSHAIRLSSLIMRLSNQPPMVATSMLPSIKTFQEGVEDAIKDEEKAYQHYGMIMQKAPWPDVFYIIADIQKDEMYHRELLKTLLDKEKHKKNH